MFRPLLRLSSGKFNKILIKLLEFSCPNMDPYYVIFVAVITSEYTLKYKQYISKLKRSKFVVKRHNLYIRD
jgi:hypothetical protein